MAYRNNVDIKTSYFSIEEFTEGCIDHIGMPFAATSWNRGLWGLVLDDGGFEITSGKKGAALFIFRGKLEVIEDHIHMIGDISIRTYGKVMLYGSIIMMSILGLLLIVSLNPVFLFFGLMMIVLPWFNVLYAMNSDALYKLIVKKVGGY